VPLNRATGAEAYRLRVQPYALPLRQPLRTARGAWTTRAGLWLELRDAQGRSGWGEVAPLPEFGSETLAQARALCDQLGATVTAAQIEAIADEFPACQFALESALADLHGAIAAPEPPAAACAQLLPAGAAALAAWQPAWQQGRRCFKWKIGVLPVAEELTLLRELAAALPEGAQLRLDANGSLDRPATERWLQAAAALPRSELVEFLEQPLPPDDLPLLRSLSRDYPTPLALDEAVATLPQLANCYARGWWGIVVIKPAIAGSPRRLRQFCQEHPVDAVFSSVLETRVGRRAALALAAELANPSRALGFGVEAWSVEAEACAMACS